jgi:hypothetical protein
VILNGSKPSNPQRHKLTPSVRFFFFTVNFLKKKIRERHLLQKSKNLHTNSLKWTDKESKYPKIIQITSRGTEQTYAETTGGTGTPGEEKKHYQSQLPKGISRKEIAEEENKLSRRHPICEHESASKIRLWLKLRPPNPKRRLIT